jgi:hypothetical protein
MKNKDILDSKELAKTNGGVYDEGTHSVEQLHYDDPVMEAVAQKTYSESLMNGQNVNMAAQNQAIHNAVKKKANSQNDSLKEITTYQATHNM